MSDVREMFASIHAPRATRQPLRGPAGILFAIPIFASARTMHPEPCTLDHKPQSPNPNLQTPNTDVREMLASVHAPRATRKHLCGPAAGLPGPSLQGKNPSYPKPPMQ